MPLKAKKSEKDFLAWNLTEKNRDDLFHCPICNDKMIPVLPEKNIIKHFRHQNGETHHEKETKEHLLGKKHIYSFLKRKGYEPQLEEKLNYKIADILLPDQDRIIEIQCSNIPTDEIKEREKNAYLEDYNITWVFGGKYYENTQNSKIFQKKHGGSYKYQKISKAERYIARTNKEELNPPIIKPPSLIGYENLLYIDKNGTLYKGSFESKYKSGGGKCKTKGWYSLQKIKEDHEKIEHLTPQMSLSDFA